MEKPGLHVTLVVDPEFGENAVTQAELGPIWVADSPANGPVMRRLWAEAKTDPGSDLTLITATIGRSSEELVIDFIDTVDEHHPNWTSFEIIGVGPTEKILVALNRLARGTVEELRSSFVFLRA